MQKDLVEICKLFLSPATILFAAIAVASTEGLKMGISFIGIGLSVMWFGRALVWPDKSADRVMALGLAGVFFVVALCSFGIHGYNFFVPGKYPAKCDRACHDPLTPPTPG